MGSLSNEEKRQIELLIPYHTYAYIARHLNRKESTVRKFCQRNGLTKDVTSVKKFAKARILENKHFAELEKQLNDDELDLAYSIYEELMKQFGGDVTYSEEVQVIDYSVVCCLLNRTLAREKMLMEQLEGQSRMRMELEDQRLEAVDNGLEEESIQIEDKLEMIDMRIQDIQDNSSVNKKEQLELIKAKKDATKEIFGSRQQRADQLHKINESFADLVLYSKKNPKWRESVGQEIEMMRLGMVEEYVRLTELHKYQNGEVELPIINVESVKRLENEE